jgi:signal transduction histidine kinase
LARLAALGLARVVSIEHGEARYILTPLGQQYREAGLLGSPDLAARLQELERLRTDLLSTIGHELRTPLTAVRTCVGLLLDPTRPPDPPTRQQLLETIARSAERMHRVLADLLDLARFRSGRIQLQQRRFDARELARDTAAAVMPLLQARGQTLSLVLPPAPVWVYGDHRRLEQVVLNLLSNAHKFSPAGSSVRLEVGERNDDVVWSVTDEGPGIALEDQQRLFERFFTTASRSTGSAGGTGLGLPIALVIAQAHGGTIEVTTAPGHGSCFSLRVPARGSAEVEEP